ncbi:MAG: hypothetical protein IIV48_05445 [Clostridium sp.]|nr:hypothetical protein [Clostridium sp.]
MDNVKKIISIVLVLTISTLIGCTKIEKVENQKLDLFDVFKGRDVAKNYLNSIKNGDIISANKLCEEELISSNVNISEGVSDISGFQLDKTIASSEFAYFIFNVIRDSNIEPKSDLESYTIKVNRKDDSYTIGEVKSKPQRELYVRNNALRIIGEQGGKSSLVISLNNIPKDTYLRENKIMLYKEKVPNNNFGKAILGFTGKRIAISTIDNKNTFICIAYIDDTLMKSGTDQVSQGESSKNNSINELQEVLEKPVTSKVVSVDLLNESTVEDFIFSKDDNNIAINYKDKLGIERLNIYKTDDGSEIETKFDDIFNKNIYNIKAQYFDDDKLFINVYKSDGNTDDITGNYNFNTKSLELIKL